MNNTPTQHHAGRDASISPLKPSEKRLILKVQKQQQETHATPVRAVMNYTSHTPTKRQQHPPGWDKITWAPKVCRKAVRRMEFGGERAAVAN